MHIFSPREKLLVALPSQYFTGCQFVSLGVSVANEVSSLPVPSFSGAQQRLPQSIIWVQFQGIEIGCNSRNWVQFQELGAIPGRAQCTAVAERHGPSKEQDSAPTTSFPSWQFPASEAPLLSFWIRLAVLVPAGT